MSLPKTATLTMSDDTSSDDRSDDTAQSKETTIEDIARNSILRKRRNDFEQFLGYTNSFKRFCRCLKRKEEEVSNTDPEVSDLAEFARTYYLEVEESYKNHFITPLVEAIPDQIWVNIFGYVPKEPGHTYSNVPLVCSKWKTIHHTSEELKQIRFKRFMENYVQYFYLGEMSDFGIRFAITLLAAKYKAEPSYLYKNIVAYLKYAGVKDVVIECKNYYSMFEYSAKAWEFNLQCKREVFVPKAIYKAFADDDDILKFTTLWKVLRLIQNKNLTEGGNMMELHLKLKWYVERGHDFETLFGCLTENTEVTNNDVKLSYYPENLANGEKPKSVIINRSFVKTLFGLALKPDDPKTGKKNVFFQNLYKYMSQINEAMCLW